MNRTIKAVVDDVTVRNEWGTVDNDVNCIMVEMVVTWLNGDPSSEDTEVIASKSFYVSHEMRPVDAPVTYVTLLPIISRGQGGVV